MLKKNNTEPHKVKLMDFSKMLKATLQPYEK